MTKTSQYSASVQGDMVGLVAFDLVLGVVGARVMDVALVSHVLGVDVDDVAAHPSGLRIPAHMVTDFESLAHGFRPIVAARRLAFAASRSFNRPTHLRRRPG